MRFVLAANWYILLWATTTVAVPTSDQLLQRAVPIPPTDDPFYVPPTALENSQPGTILRSRSINDLSIGGVVPFQAEAAYQLLYRTTDSLGDASAAVTTIIVPKNANSSRLLSYQMATDAAWPNCAPSYILQLGSSLKNGGSGAAETLLVIAALNQGWIVNLPNITSVMLSSNKGLFTGLIPAGVIGLTNGYPVLKEYLHKNLVPSTASKFYKASTQCLGSNIASFLGQDIGLYLDHGLSTLFTSIAKDVLAITGQMGLYGTPKMPIFLYKAISDEVSVVGDTDAVVSKLCSQGANINYARDMFGGHATEAITGAGDAFTFLIDRFNGVPTTSGCTTNNVWTVTFNPRAITALGPAVASALLALLQVPVGPSDMF